MLTCKILELKGQIPEVKWNALWEDYRKFVEKKNKKINQLETNIEEALKFIKYEWYYDGTPIDIIEEILERGKE